MHVVCVCPKLRRKLRLWNDPESKGEKITLGISLKQNTWSVHELPTSANEIANLGNADGSIGGGGGEDDSEFNFHDYNSNGGNVENDNGNKKGSGTNLL